MFERRCALSPPAAPGAAQGAPRPLTAGEVRAFALLQAEAFADSVAALADVVRLTLGVDLPRDTSAPRHAGGYRVFKLGAARFWIVGPDDARADSKAWSNTMRGAVPAAMGSVTSLSHSRTRLFIEGPAARDVLAKGIALDLHPGAFPLDACALTALEDTPILLHRTASQRYELYVLRTYAGWIWEWLADAALPCGCDPAAGAER